MGMKVSCSTCAFFFEFPNTNHGKFAIGQCRFNAPKNHVDRDGLLKTIWPVVRDTDFCGEHAVGVEEDNG